MEEGRWRGGGGEEEGKGGNRGCYSHTCDPHTDTNCVLNPDFLIVGEPTASKVMRFQKGALKVKVHTTGVACHSGYPEAGVSAISKLLTILHEVEHVAQWPEDGSIGKTTVNVGMVSGGQVRQSKIRLNLHGTQHNHRLGPHNDPTRKKSICCHKIHKLRLYAQIGDGSVIVCSGKIVVFALLTQSSRNIQSRMLVDFAEMCS